MQAVDTYQKMMHLTNEDKASLTKLQKQIGQTEDLKCLFLLLLQQYDPHLQSKQYLQDLIVTNHNYLLFLDQMSKKDLMDHLKQ